MRLWQRRTVGILTLGGGAIGFAVGLTLLISRSNPLEWLFCIAFMAVYAWGVLCGTRLLECEKGAEHSALKYWLVQVPSFSSPILGYFLSSGFHVTVSLQLAPFKLNGNFMVGSQFNYSLMQPEQPWSVGFNLFAAAIVWWLARTVRGLSPNNSFKPNPLRGSA